MKRATFFLLCLLPGVIWAQFTGHDFFLSDSRGSGSSDVIFSYDLDDGIGSTLNASTGDLDIYHDLGGNDPYIRGMDVDETGVYWTTNTGEIMFKAHGSATATTLYSGLGTSLQKITVSGSNVFWHDSDADAVYKGSTGGSGVLAASVLTGSITILADMHATSDTIYYFSGSNNLVRQIDIATGTASTLTSISGETFTQFTGISVYNGKIYAASTGIARHYSMDIDGTNQQQLTQITQFNIDDIDVVSGVIFLLDDGGSFGAQDSVIIYQLSDLSQNGTLVSNITYSAGLAVYADSAVPEPSAAAFMLGLVAGAIGLRRRRRA